MPGVMSRVKLTGTARSQRPPGRHDNPDRVSATARRSVSPARGTSQGRPLSGRELGKPGATACPGVRVTADGDRGQICLGQAL